MSFVSLLLFSVVLDSATVGNFSGIVVVHECAINGPSKTNHHYPGASRPIVVRMFMDIMNE